MPSLLKFSLIAAILGCSLGTHGQAKDKLKDLLWLEGSWERIDMKDGRKALEVWEVHAEEIRGIGVTLKRQDTLFVEYLSIKEENGQLFYIAEVAHNKKPVFFEIVSWDKHHFVCENPKHDFPKSIQYRKKKNEIVATISDGLKSAEFRFRKKN